MSTIYQSIPGYTELARLEQQRRQEAWLGLEDDICGIPMAPLTLRRALYLSLARNPYIAGAGPGDQTTPAHLAQVLWVCSQAFTEGCERARNRFYKSIRRIQIAQAVAGVEAYIEAAFFDLSPGDKPTGAASPSDWVSSIINRYAADYCWSPERVLDMPIRQIIQLDRASFAADPQTRRLLVNPLTDPLVARHLEQLNAHLTKPTACPAS